jgi:hypothetical protein
MRKRLSILVPALMLMVLSIAFTLINSRQTPAWEPVLNRYLTYLQTTGAPPYTVINSVQASQPGNFTSSMSAGSFSDNVISQTSQTTDTPEPASFQPIIYPPDSIWCVLLADGNQRELVFVALHNSLYNADWIVHISPDPWGSAELGTTLENLGCKFDSRQ